VKSKALLEADHDNEVPFFSQSNIAGKLVKTYSIPVSVVTTSSNTG